MSYSTCNYIWHRSLQRQMKKHQGGAGWKNSLNPSQCFDPMHPRLGNRLSKAVWRGAEGSERERTALWVQWMQTMTLDLEELQPQVKRGDFTSDPPRSPGSLPSCHWWRRFRCQGQRYLGNWSASSLPHCQQTPSLSPNGFNYPSRVDLRAEKVGVTNEELTS